MNLTISILNISFKCLLFIAWICVLLGILLYFKSKRGLIAEYLIKIQKLLPCLPSVNISNLLIIQL